MKRLFLNLLILTMSITPVWAERVDLNVARQVAENMGAQMTGNTQLRMAAEPELVYIATAGNELSNLRSTDFNGEADFYVFNYPNQQGYVIVSGEDRAYPVLGYSRQGSFNALEMPANVSSWLRSYQKQIGEAVKQNVEASAEVIREWKMYLKGDIKPVKEVLLKTANWDQVNAFNSYSKGFPEMKDGSGKAITGCVATAMGIIMKYYAYPKHTTGKGVSKYLVELGTEPFTIDYNGDYQWENMLMDYKEGEYTSEQAEEVSRLLWHCGVNANMEYNSVRHGGSGADTHIACKAMIDVFGYSPSIRYLIKMNYEWPEWKDLIRTEIDADRPIMYGNSDHQFICDGYNGYGFFHMNWGWSGKDNGFFRLSSMTVGLGDDMSKDQSMVTHIIPDTKGEPFVYEPFFGKFQTTNKADNISEVSLELFTMGYKDTVSIYAGLGVIDDQQQIVQVPNTVKEVELISLFTNMAMEEEEDEGDEEEEYEGEVVVFSTDLSALKAGEQMVPMFSLDGKTWKPMRVMRIDGKKTAVALSKDGFVYKEDVETDPSWPSIDANGLTQTDFKVVSFTDESLNDPAILQANTRQIVYHFPVEGDYMISYEMDVDLRHYKIYQGESADEMRLITEELDGFEGLNIKVNKNQIKNGTYTDYLRILSDRPITDSLSISVAPIMDGFILPSQIDDQKYTFVVADQPTSNEAVLPSVTQMWTEKGVLFIQTQQPCNMRVVNLKGACVKAQALSVGTTNVSLKPGLYVVNLDNSTFKVRIP